MAEEEEALPADRSTAHRKTSSGDVINPDAAILAL